MRVDYGKSRADIFRVRTADEGLKRGRPWSSILLSGSISSRYLKRYLAEH